MISYADYSPYGTLLDGRHGNDDTYRYGFNGMERDDELKGNGNSYDFGARMHDPRIGRWFSVDKVVKSHLSPYQFAKNNGIIYIDSDGNDEIWFVITSSVVKGERQYTVSYEFIDDKNAEVTF